MWQSIGSASPPTRKVPVKTPGSFPVIHCLRAVIYPSLDIPCLFQVCKSFREKSDGNPLLIWERLDEDYDDDDDDDDTEEDDSDEDDMEDDEEEGNEDDDEGVGNKDELKPKENASTSEKDKGNENCTPGNSDQETDPPDGESSDAKSQRNQTQGTDHGGFKEGLPYRP